MRKPLYFRLCLFLSALIVFQPFSAIGYEATARDKTLLYLAIMNCLRDEGYVTQKEGVELVQRLLKREGISIDRAMKIMEDTEDLKTDIKGFIKYYGGCKKMGDDFSHYLKK